MRRCAGSVANRAFEDNTCIDRLGWWAVVLRMEVFNAARPAPGERSVIVDYLAEHQGVRQVRIVLEWIAAVGVVALAPLSWLGWQAASWRRARSS